MRICGGGGQKNAECRMKNEGVGFADEISVPQGVGIADSHWVSANLWIVLRGRRVGAPTFFIAVRSTS